MKNRATDALLKCGIPCNIKGFPILFMPWSCLMMVGKMQRLLVYI